MAPPFPKTESPQEKAHYEGHRQRLRDRFSQTDGTAFADYELLELLLFSLYPRRDVKPLAKTLLSTFGNFSGVFHAKPQDLMAIPGVGESAVVFLKALKETAIRLSRVHVMERDIFDCWDAVIDYCRLQSGHEPVEQFRILFLNKKNHLIADEAQHKGTVDHAAVYPREVVKRALEVGASAMILLHNHPSGDPTPSAADIDVTLRIMEAARPLSITVHDHLIMTHSNYSSLKALGLV